MSIFTTTGGGDVQTNNTYGYNLNPETGPENELFGENYSGGYELSAFNGLSQTLNSGQFAPNANDYGAAYTSNQNLATMYGKYAAGGYLPTAGDINTASGVSQNLFAGQQAQLNNSFYNQTISANRLAGASGRDVNDPILQAKLQTGFSQQQQVLSAEEQAQTQSIASAMPGQRLGYAQQQNQTLNGIAQQYTANNQYLIGLGSQLGGQFQNYNLATSQKYNNTGVATSSFQNPSIVQDVGAGLGIAAQLYGLASGGGGGASGGFGGGQPGQVGGPPTDYIGQSSGLGQNFNLAGGKGGNFSFNY